MANAFEDVKLLRYIASDCFAVVSSSPSQQIFQQRNKIVCYFSSMEHADIKSIEVKVENIQ